MKLFKTIKKGTEPAIAIPIITFIVKIISEQIGLDSGEKESMIITGFLYGLYRAGRNFFKHRKK